MAKKEYDWVVGEAPPKIELHSFAKHKVYEEYLLHYIQVLNSNPIIPKFDITLIDGFTGGGIYTNPMNGEIYVGSPLRLYNTVKAAEAKINLDRQRQNIREPFKINARFLFVEKKKCNFNFLKDHLGKIGLTKKLDDRLKLINNSFVNELDSILAYIEAQKQSKRCIFILDQYGYVDVPFGSIKKIFRRLPNAEIILTFATDWLISYLSDNEKFINGLKKTGLHEILDVPELVELKKDSKEWRKLIQIELHKAIFSLSGAKHYTPFFIISRESNRSFWLVHLSNHPKARDVMTQLHWNLKNHFTHYGGAGLGMLGYDPTNDSKLTKTEDLFCNTEYSFDAEAHEQTINRLSIDIPKYLYNFSEDGLKFNDFYRQVSNHTPATTDIIKEVIINLQGCKEVVINEQNGRPKRRVANTIKNDDIIQIPRQFKLF